MKKFLLILSLIYFASCKTLCSDETKPERGADCLSRATEVETTHCCYVDAVPKSGGDSLLQCLESPKKTKLATLKESIIEQLESQDFTLKDIGCPDVPEEVKTSCGAKTEPGEFKECFDRSVISEDKNHCCYYKLNGDSFSEAGCIEVSKSYSLEKVKDKYFSEYLEKGVKVDALICPRKVDDSTQEPEGGSYCNSELTVSKKEDCFRRNIQGDKDKYYCCFMRVKGSDEDYNMCAEYQKSVAPADIEQKLNDQYAEYGLKISDFSCPTAKEETKTEDTTKDTTKDEPKDTTAADTTGSDTNDNVKEANKGSYLRPELLLIFALLI